MHEKELEALGLSANQAKIYFALLELGEAGPAQLTLKTGMHRGYIYDVLTQLMEKSAVTSQVSDGKLVFRAVEPARLADSFEEKLEAFRKVLPQLQAISHTGTQMQVELYRGKNLVRTAFKDAMARMKHGDEFLGTVYDDKELMAIEPIIFQQYLRFIKKNKITERIIVPKGSQAYTKATTTTYRQLDKKYLSTLMVWIYANRVFLVIAKAPQIGVMITSKEFADTYRQQFEIFWRAARPVRGTFS